LFDLPEVDMLKRPVILLALLFFTTLLLAALSTTVARAEFGTNWTAQYYNNRNLDGNPARTESGINGINFNYGTGSPNNDVDDDDFSIRFSSTQTFAGGTYEFVLSSDDGARVFIDGVLVLDRWVSRPLTTDRFTQTLAAGNHNLVVEYFENNDQASIQFQWFLVSGGGGFVTPGAFITPGFFSTPFGPTVTPVPTGPQAVLTYVRGLALRTGPYLGATFVTTLKRDVSYSVSGRNNSEGVYNWYLLTTPDGRQGWASGRYLQVNVDILTLPEVGSIFDQIDGAPHLGVVAWTRTVLNMRARPSTRTAVVSQTGIGEPFELIGRTVQANTDQWYQVRRAPTGEVGWISAAWVTVRGEINAVPIR